MNKIASIIKNIRPDINIETSSLLIDDAILDSLDIIRLISELESEYNISIPADAITPEGLNSIESIQKLINKFID